MLSSIFFMKWIDLDSELFIYLICNIYFETSYSSFYGLNNTRKTILDFSTFFINLTLFHMVIYELKNYIYRYTHEMHANILSLHCL